MQYIQDSFNVKVEASIINIQFFSYKDNKVLDFKKIYEKLRETHIVYFEPDKT